MGYDQVRNKSAC